MTINELHIKFDLNYESKATILKDLWMNNKANISKCDNGYLFVDSLDGYCYLFNKYGNENLKKIKNIGNSAFFNRKYLKSIKIPDSVKRIGNNAFELCANLESVVIPNSVKSIGDFAFSYCENLKSIVIPNSVKSIGNYAFIYCESLKSLSFKGKTIDQVKAMDYYPFGIKDKSIIKCI